MSKTITNIKISDGVVEVVEANKNLTIAPNGTGALVASKTGNSRGSYAVDLQIDKDSNSQVASGLCSVIGGGRRNTVSASFSVVSGGQGNSCTGVFNFVGGGNNNSASASYSVYASSWGYATVCGGDANNASGIYCFIGGGQNNTASAYYVYIAGSYSAYVYGHSTVCGGKNNTASGYYSFVGGGLYNTAGAQQSTVSGGNGNNATGFACTIGGGSTNTASAATCTIGGGSGNIASAGTCTIGGGSGNTVSAGWGTIGGGTNNLCSGSFCTVGGGDRNTASGSYSFVPGGYQAKATRFGEQSHAAGQFSNKGDAQHTTLVARTQTLSGNFTVSIASPAVFTKNGHGLRAGDVITLSTTGTLPTGLTASTVSSITGYTVVSEGLTVNTFRVSSGGNTVNTSGTQSGTHSLTVYSSYLYLDNASAKPTIPAETTWTFTVSLTAHNDTDNEGGWWIFRGGMKRNASNTTTFIGSVITEYGTDASLSSATASVGPDTSGGALYIQAGGVSQKNIRWVAIVDISQVSYGTP
jgi:hypothetical protein